MFSTVFLATSGCIYKGLPWSPESTREFSLSYYSVFVPVLVIRDDYNFNAVLVWWHPKAQSRTATCVPALTNSHITLTITCDVASQPPPRGLLPAAYDETLHIARCLAQLRSKDKPIEKYIYLSELKHTNEDLFYRLCLANMPVCSQMDPPLSRLNH